MQSYLLSLPNEIQIMIMKFVLIADVKNFVSLTSTCRRLYRLGFNRMLLHMYNYKKLDYVIVANERIFQEIT